MSGGGRAGGLGGEGGVREGCVGAARGTVCSGATSAEPAAVVGSSSCRRAERVRSPCAVCTY